MAGCVQAPPYRAAPRDGHGPLRPRQVRAGVPRPLDAICERVLTRTARPRPIETAHELAAALTDYIGELATADPGVVTSSEAPLAPAVLDDPETAEPTPSASPDPDEPDQDDGHGVEATAVAVPVLGAAVAATEEPEPDPVPDDFAPEDVPWDDAGVGDAEPEPEPTELFAALPDSTDDEAAATPDPEATQVAVPAFQEPLTADDASSWDSSWDPTGTPTGTVPVVASHPRHRLRWNRSPSGRCSPPRAPAVRPRASRPGPRPTTGRPTARGTWHRHRPCAPTRTNESTGPIWPFGEDPDVEPDDWEERTRSHWLRTPLSSCSRSPRLVRSPWSGSWSAARRPTPAPPRPRAPARRPAPRTSPPAR